MIDSTRSAVIHSCQPGELDAVLELWTLAGSVPSVSDDAVSLQAVLDADPGAILVAELGGTVVGSLIAAWDGWRGNMYRLAVVPAQRRRGVASALLAEGERRLRAKGARRLSALVVESHGEAVGFWEANGYRHDERVARFVKSCV